MLSACQLLTVFPISAGSQVWSQQPLMLLYIYQSVVTSLFDQTVVTSRALHSVLVFNSLIAGYFLSLSPDSKTLSRDASPALYAALVLYSLTVKLLLNQSVPWL